MSYILKPRQKVLMLEIPFPRDERCLQAVRQVLDAFLDAEGICSIPSIKAYLIKHPESEQSLVLHLKKIISGCTWWPCWGRFVAEDEPSSIVRFIVHDPDAGPELPLEMCKLAREVILHLICQRLADEFGAQEAVWAIEYEECYLHQWIRQPDEDKSNDASQVPINSSPENPTAVFLVPHANGDYTGHESCE